MTKKKNPKNRERALKGSGSKWQRLDGRYSAAIVIPRHDPLTGRITRKKESTTRNNEEEVDIWLARKRHEISESGGVLPGLSTPHKEQTLREHLEAWLRDSVEPRVAPNTLQKRIWAASNHIAPALGHLLLSAISPREVQSLYAKLSREGYSAATCREIHVTLRQSLGQAVRWGLLSQNPASPELVDAPKQTRARQPIEDDEEVRALSDAQARKLFAYAEESNSRWRHYYVVAVRTGLRPGEALGLRWGDLDLSTDPASLRVRRTLDTHHAARFGPPKSKASRRTLALHHEAKVSLAAQREMLAGAGLPIGSKALVFPSNTGTPMNSGNLRKRHLQKELAMAKLPTMTLHELRHTFASIMLHEWLVPPAIVQKMMGHDSIRITMDLYGHLIPGAEADVIRRLNDRQQGETNPISGHGERSTA